MTFPNPNKPAPEDPAVRRAKVLEERAAWEARGALVRSCPGCAPFYMDPDRYPRDVFAPRHQSRCGAGYAHCTCRSCF